MERRKHYRFSPTAFMNRPVMIEPLQPFFGKPIKGKLIDLSAGGMAVLIDQIIPLGTLLDMSMTFPDHSIVESVVKVRYMLPKERDYLHGIEFLTLAANMGERIDRMSQDYIDCENRIQRKDLKVCNGTSCSFYTMCMKSERSEVVLDIEPALTLALKVTDSSALPAPSSPSVPTNLK